MYNSDKKQRKILQDFVSFFGGGSLRGVVWCEPRFYCSRFYGVARFYAFFNVFLLFEKYLPAILLCM